MQSSETVFNWKMFLICVLILLIIFFVVMLLVIPVRMANKRGRSGLVWFLFSLVISPFLCMILIYFLGETEEKRKQRIIEDEKLRNLYRVSSNENSDYNLKKWQTENPGKSLNDFYHFKSLDNEK